ncbi:hypothetical protein BWQ96_04508 [Gracilariopsis chorda]|uniref:Uncharacterized protein n=1 Tax=Gracilariopsis chorda TaxID=448386 RepID=A0A2V3IX75_9FLOR|nr:hypothetical protein BWQ96_04508 [Gracilariopsis chorda]|eukprot:PXF45740.1 hypothetical protein BWQ96_04508 [Gracilariopsis chorda]
MLASKHQDIQPIVESMRTQEADKDKIQNDNFNLKLELDQLRKQMDRNNKRDSSASLQPENYYTFDGDGHRRDSQRSDIMTATEKADAIMVELTEAQVRYAQLWNQFSQLQQEYDHLSVKAKQTERDYEKLSMNFQQKADESLQRQNDSRSKLEILRKDLQAARDKVEAIKNVAEETKREKDEAIRRWEESQKKIDESHIRSDGLQMEKDVIQAALAEARSSLMEERTRAKKKDDALLRAEQLAKESRQLLQKEKALREEKDNLLSQKAAELEGALRKANDYLSDREAIKSTLRAEVQRTETWEDAKRIMEEGKRFIAAESRAYADLKKTIEEGKSKFSDRSEYNPSWREEVATHLNACAKMLSLLQAETLSRRLYVLKCGTPAGGSESKLAVS